MQEKYGADHVINYETTPAWGAEVTRLTGGRGIYHVLDNGGAGTIEQSLEAAAFGGVVSGVGFLAAPHRMPDVAALALAKGAVVRGIMVGSRQQLADVARLVVARGLQVPVEREFGFGRGEVVAAFEYLASGQHMGKICINVQ